MTQNQEKEIKANNSKDPKMTQMLETADKNLQRDMKYLFKNLKENTVFFQVGGGQGVLHGCGILALRPGSQGGPLQGNYKVLTTGPPGKSQKKNRK